MKTMNGFLAGVISLFFSASLFAADQTNTSFKGPDGKEFKSMEISYTRVK